jgi:hypothetical protein
LAGRHAGVCAATTSEQELAGPLVGSLQIIIDGLAGLFTHFKSDRPFLLTDRCAIRGISAGGDILDPDGDDITAAKLTVDRQIEHGQVASAAFDLEFRPDRPDVSGSQRWLRPDQLALVPGVRVGLFNRQASLSDMVVLLGY